MGRGHINLRSFLSALQAAGEIVEVDTEIDPKLELAEVHRRVAAADGPALLFRRVKGSSFPVVTNLFGSTRRVDLAFGGGPEKLVADLIKLATRDFPPSFKTLLSHRQQLGSLLRLGTRRRRRIPVMEQSLANADLTQLPLLTSWPEDGGPFVTLPLVYTEPPGGGPPNLGMYRLQRHDKNTLGLHWQIAKGGGFHYHQAEQQNQPLPVHVYVGGPPALMLSAICPLPENVPELMLCSLLQGSKLSMGRSPQTPYPIVGEAEFAIIGQAPPCARRPEGPFGDHYGYYSWTHDFPYLKCRTVYHRHDAIYPATVVGKPRQEDFYIGEYLQKLLSPLFPVVMPAVRDLWSYGETGFHSLTAAVVKERFYRESMTSAFRILGEGQLSLSKFVMLTDKPVNLQNFPEMLTTVLERFRPETDLFVFSNLCLDTLDYSGPKLNEGSRGVMLGVGDPVRTLPREFQGSLPRPLTAAKAFSPGCLVVEAPPYEQFDSWNHLLDQPDFAEWPLIFVVDNLAKATKDTASFLWTAFTRFEPAADIHAHADIARHHLVYRGPIVIDARMKPSYPKEVLCDPDTSKKVSERWHEYFPQGMVMGDSDTAHVV